MTPTDDSAADSPSPNLPDPGRLAGIDFGTVRIGIAISDPSRRWASPLEIRTRSGQEADAKYFLRLVREHDLTGFVVGLPIHLDGRESEKSSQARAFAEWLGKLTSLPVVLFDERYTSVEAENYLLAADMTRKRRKKRIDKVAAQILLAAYLDSIRAKSRLEDEADAHQRFDDPGSIDG